MKKCKVFVTNITSDEEHIKVGKNYIHKLICDCTLENGSKETNVCRIVSTKEYHDIMTKGYYEVDDLDA